MIYAVDRKELLQLIFILTVFISVLPTFLKATIPVSNIFWFFLIYIIAAYIRLYNPAILNKKYCLALGIAVYGLCLLSCFLFDILGTHWPVFSKYTTYFSGINMTTTLVTSVLLFAGFKNLSMNFRR